MSNEKKGFGFIDDNSKDLQSKAKSRGEFGLNTGNISVFVYNDKAGKDSSAGDAVDITFKVKEQEYRRRVYDVTRERIRQIESKALRKLRHPSRLKKLKDYLK